MCAVPIQRGGIADQRERAALHDQSVIVSSQSTGSSSPAVKHNVAALNDNIVFVFDPPGAQCPGPFDEKVATRVADPALVVFKNVVSDEYHGQGVGEVRCAEHLLPGQRHAVQRQCLGSVVIGYCTVAVYVTCVFIVYVKENAACRVIVYAVFVNDPAVPLKPETAEGSRVERMVDHIGEDSSGSGAGDFCAVRRTDGAFDPAAKRPEVYVVAEVESIASRVGATASGDLSAGHHGLRRGGQRTDPAALPCFTIADNSSAQFKGGKVERRNAAARCDCRALRNRTARQCQRAAVRADTAAVPCRAIFDAAALHEKGAAGAYQNTAAVSGYMAVADGSFVHGEGAFRTNTVSEFFNDAAVHEEFCVVRDPDAGPVGIPVGTPPDRTSEERELAGLIFFFDRDAVLREDDLALSGAVGNDELSLGDLYAGVFRQRDRFTVQAETHTVRERAVVLLVKRYVVRQVPMTVFVRGVNNAVVIAGKVIGLRPRRKTHVGVRRVVADGGIPAADAVVVFKPHDDSGGFLVIGKDISLPCVPRGDKMRQVVGCQCVVFAPDEPDGIGFDSGRHGFLQIPSHIERDLQVLVKGPVYPDGRVLIFPRVAYKRPDGTVINQNVISPCFPGGTVLITVAGEPDVAGKVERRTRIDVDSRAGTACGGNAVRHCGVSGKIGSRASSIRAVQRNSGFPAGGDMRVAGHIECPVDPDAAQEVPDGSRVHGEGCVLCDADASCVSTLDGAASRAVGDGQRMASLHGEHIPVFRYTAASLNSFAVQADVHIFIDFELPVEENVVFEIVVARLGRERIS